MRMRQDDETIILANPDILSESHVPPDIHGRESQLKEIGICLRPITEGGKPVNCWFHGKPGIGKTTTACWTLRKFEIEVGIKGMQIQNGVILGKLMGNEK